MIGAEQAAIAPNDGYNLFFTVKALATSGAERIPALPDLPPLTGVRADLDPGGATGNSWHGGFAPAGTGDAIIANLSTEMVNIVGDLGMSDGDDFQQHAEGFAPKRREPRRVRRQPRHLRFASRSHPTSATLTPDKSEADLAGLGLSPSRLFATPRVTRAPIALECRYVKTGSLQALDGSAMHSALVIGQVVSAFIDDELDVEGMVDLSRSRVLSRLGYLDYGVLGDIFLLSRP